MIVPFFWRFFATKTSTQGIRTILKDKNEYENRVLQTKDMTKSFILLQQSYLSYLG